MGSIIDMHVHTIVGSMDSDISPRRLAEMAQHTGLSGVVLTEHLNHWRPEDVERLRQESGLFAFNAREWSTEMGHIIALGLDHGVRNILRAADLRRAADEHGALLILAHPFRYFPGPSSLLFRSTPNAEKMGVEELAGHPAFKIADAIEVLNGGCIERENQLALEVARYLGKPAVAGSDAHIPMELGRYVTLFEKELTSEEEMLAELRSGRFQAAQRLGDAFVPLGESVPS
ncbi:MAG: PHP domain-containing protein [Chloroflexi bacterium]|nr:PHP domain-containing protein [Chloroflexota bacterium]